MTEAKHSPLMDCPFCGGAPVKRGQYVECGDCSAQGPTDRETITGWNTRAATSLHHELVAALEAAQAHFLKYTGGFAANKEEATVFDKMRSALQKAKQGDKP